MYFWKAEPKKAVDRHERALEAAGWMAWPADGRALFGYMRLARVFSVCRTIARAGEIAVRYERPIVVFVHDYGTGLFAGL